MRNNSPTQQPSSLKPDWEYATWSGSRKAMIQRSLQLTVRERLLALEELGKTSQHLASIKKKSTD